MGRFIELGFDMDLTFPEKLNENFDKTDEDLAEQSQRMIEIEQASIDRDNEHKNSTTAHDAEHITYSGTVEGTNVKQAIEHVNDRVGNVLTSQITGKDNEVIDARLGADGLSRETAGDLIREVHEQQLQSDRQEVALNTGLNLVETDRATPMVPNIKGRTLVNWGCNYGDFEKDTSGDGIPDGLSTFNLQEGAVKNTDEESVDGGKSLQIDSNVDDPYTSRGVKLQLGNSINDKYILALTMLKCSGESAVGRFTVYDQTAVKTLNAYITESKEWETAYVTVLVPETENLDIIHYNYSDVGAVNSVYFDKTRVYEITAEEYAKIDVDPEWTGDKLAEKFPYIEGVKHLTNPVITKVGKNLLPPFTEWNLHEDAAVITPNELELNAIGNWKSSYVDVPVMPNQEYTFSYTVEQIDDIAYVYFTPYKTDGTIITPNTTILTGEDTIKTFAIPSGVNLIRFWLGNSNNPSKIIFKNPMLAIGDSVQPFEQQNNDYIYIETKLASNLDGTVSDEFYYRDDKPYVLKKWEKDLVL
ncbi:hypothetical protein ERL59_17605, partial [Chengkuizengella sp. YPA3-1-1]|nr:hypothetical protein [Chengkuizengella marina]